MTTATIVYRPNHAASDHTFGEQCIKVLANVDVLKSQTVTSSHNQVNNTTLRKKALSTR